MKKEIELINFYIKENELIISAILGNPMKNNELKKQDCIRFENRIKVLKEIIKRIINN